MPNPTGYYALVFPCEHPIPLDGRARQRGRFWRWLTCPQCGAAVECVWLHTPEARSPSAGAVLHCSRRQYRLP